MHLRRLLLLVLSVPFGLLILEACISSKVSLFPNLPKEVDRPVLPHHLTTGDDGNTPTRQQEQEVPWQSVTSLALRLTVGALGKQRVEVPSGSGSIGGGHQCQ